MCVQILLYTFVTFWLSVLIIAECRKLIFVDVMPMGLFCSLLPLPGQKTGLRLMKKDITSSMLFDLRVYDGHHDMSGAQKSEQPLASTTVERWYKAKGVTVHEVEHGRIRGKLFLPEG